MNDRTNKPDDELGILARRKIEAAIIAPIYDEIRKSIGEEKARDFLRRAIRRAAIDAGAEFVNAPARYLPRPHRIGRGH